MQGSSFWLSRAHKHLNQCWSINLNVISPEKGNHFFAFFYPWPKTSQVIIKETEGLLPDSFKETTGTSNRCISTLSLPRALSSPTHFSFQVSLLIATMSVVTSFWFVSAVFTLCRYTAVFILRFPLTFKYKTLSSWPKGCACVCRES